MSIGIGPVRSELRKGTHQDQVGTGVRVRCNPRLGAMGPIIHLEDVRQFLDL